MSLIYYITVSEAIEINKSVILKYSKTESIRVIDPTLLDSAINRPKQSVFGEDAYTTIFSKAAALLESIAKNHSFANANKRTGFACMVYFLYMNGYEFRMDEKQAEDFAVDVVKHKYSFEEIAEIIKKHSFKH